MKGSNQNLISNFILLVIVIGIIFSSVAQQKEDLILLNNQEENLSSLILDNFDEAIEPYCEGRIDINHFRSKDFSKINLIKIEIIESQKFYVNLFKLLLDQETTINQKYKSRFKSNLTVIFSNNVECLFSAKLRISGDYKDHLNPELFITSLDVNLETGNIFGITEFKLLLPNTRGSNSGNNEVFLTTFLKHLGYKAPQTSFVNVNINNLGNLSNNEFRFIFQEKIAKEFLESNNLREGPIVELNQDNFFADSNKQLIFGEIKNKSWSTRSIENLSISAEALQTYNTNLFLSSAPNKIMNHESFKSLTNESYELLTLIHALSGKHANQTINNIFYFNKFKNSLDLIYYDGNSRLQGKKSYELFYDFQEINNFYISESKKLYSNLNVNKNLLREDLKKNNLDLTEMQLENYLEEVFSNLLKISKQKPKLLEDKELLDYFYNLDNQNIQFLFFNYRKNEAELCNQFFNECKLYKNDNFSQDLIFDLIDKKDVYLFGVDKKKFLAKQKLYQQNLIYLEDNIVLEYFGTPEINIDKNSKKIDLKFNSFNDRIIIKSTSNEKEILDGWLINLDSTFLNNVVKSDENLLTGCLTIYNMRFSNSVINSKNLFCEDSINFIDVFGNNITLTISNSKQDAVDFDFSIIKNLIIKVDFAGNDCLDLSGGVYNINSLSLTNCNDKGLSVGEVSSVSIIDASIFNSFYGVVVKDSSEVIIENIIFNEVSNCLSLYRKKQEFAGSSLVLDNNNCKVSEEMVQKGSEVFGKS